MQYRDLSHAEPCKGGITVVMRFQRESVTALAVRVRMSDKIAVTVKMSVEIKYLVADAERYQHQHEKRSRFSIFPSPRNFHRTQIYP
jgi:hypothetical protein